MNKSIYLPKRLSLLPMFLLIWAALANPLFAQDCCDQGDKPNTLTVTYTGQGCGATNTSQDEDKYSCSGNPNGDQSVFIIASEDDDGGGKIWFTGNVNINQQFTITSANAGEDDFKSRTYFLIYSSQGGNLLQTAEIHTSCSAPIVVGEQVGAIRIENVTFKNGVNCGPPPNPCVATFTNEGSQVGILWQYFGNNQWNNNPITIQPGATVTQNVGDGQIWEIWNQADNTMFAQFVIDCDGGTEYCFTQNGGTNCIPPEECPVPVINAPSQQICPGEPVMFSAEDLGYPCLEYTWNFGNNATPSTASGLGPVSVVFSSLGNVNVSLSIDNNCVNTTPPNPPIVFGCCNQDERGEHDHPHKLILEYVGGGSPNVIFRSTENGSFTFFSGQVSNGTIFTVDGTGHTDKHGELNRLDTNTEFKIGSSTYEEVHTSCSQDISPGFGITSNGDLVQNGTSSNSVFIVRGIVMLNTGSGSSIYCEEGNTDPGSSGGGDPANGTTVCGSNCFDCEETTTVTVTVEECDPCISNSPQATVSKTEPFCGQSDGSITFTFPDNPTRTNIEFSINGGNTYFPSVADNLGSVTYGNLAPGTYDLSVRWGNDECPTDLGQITLKDDGIVANADKTNPSCGQYDGSITFTFLDNPNRSQIEFSIDGGGSYPFNVPDNSGSTTISNLPAGTYDLYVRWGNNDCPTDLGSVMLTGGSQAPGTTCDDGNPNTINDVIQADGCSCAGTPAGPDCEEDITITAGNGKITVTGLDGSSVSSLQIFNSSWQQEFSCFANCNATEMVNLAPGTYYVYAKYYTATYGFICEKQATVTVTGGCPDADGDGTCDPNDCAPLDPFYPAAPGTPCNDGDPNTNNDVVQADGCSCAGTPAPPVCDNVVDGGTIGFGPDCLPDITVTCGSAVLAIKDCVSPSGGTGDLEVIWLKSTTSCAMPTSTADDIIAGNDPHWTWIPGETGLTLSLGTVTENTCYLRCSRRVGCEVYYESNIISLTADCGSGDPDCDTGIGIATGNGTITVTGLDGAPVSSLQVFTSAWQQEFSCFADCGASRTLDVAAGTYYVYAKYYTAGYGLICEKQATVTVTGGGGSGCPDADGDGTCDSNDCQPNNDEFPATPGTACDDGNPNTFGDAVTADGCGCAGTVVNNGDPDCGNVSIDIAPGSIGITGLDGAPVISVQIFSSAWQTVHQCFADCDSPSASFPVSAGTHYVYVKYYTAGYQLICEVSETLDIPQLLEAKGTELEFKAVKHLEHTELLWIHDGDYLVDGYVLERSGNGVEFGEIYSVPSERDESADAYQGFDLEPLAGDNFYRIRMEMSDGSTEYSGVEKVHFQDFPHLMLFPNPANGFVTANLEDITGFEDVTITIYNGLGLQVKRFSLDEVRGRYYQMDIRDVREGHYVVWFDIPDRRSFAKRLVVGKI